MRRVLLWCCAAAFCAAAAAWFGQAGLLTYGANRFSGGLLRVDGASGDLRSGLRFYGVHFRTPSLRAEAAEVFLLPVPSKIFSGSPAIAELRVVSPRVTLLSSPNSGRSAAPVLPNIRHAVISDGRLEAGGKTVSDIEAVFSSSGGKLDVISCSANSAGLSAVFSGSYAPGRASALGRLSYPPAKTDARIEYSLLGEKHRLSAAGTASGAPFKLEGWLEGDAWKASLFLDGSLPLDLLRPTLEPVKIVSASLTAAGSGFTRDTAAANGKFSLQVSSGRSAEAAFAFNRGNGELSGTYAYGGVSGVLSAAIRGKLLSGGWQAEGGGEFLLPGERQLYVGGLKAACSLGGSLETPAGACELKTDKLISGAMTADGAKISGAFTAGPAENLKVRFSLQNPVLSRIRFDSAVLEAEGSRKKNSFSLHASYPAGSAALKGSSSYADGVWKAALENLSLSVAPAWGLCAPAAVQVSTGGGAELSGFCLASGESRITFSGIFRTPFPEEFHAAVTGFALTELRKTGVTGLNLGGVVNAAADYSAAKAAAGVFSASADNLELEGLDLGTANAGGTFSPGKVLLERADWKIYGGEARASGWAAIKDGRREAEFSVKASSMNIAPLLALQPQFSAAKVWVEGESRLSLRGDVLTSSGAMNLFSPRLALIPFGLELDNVSVHLEAGDLSSARISASARKNGGRITAAGAVSASGPSIKIRASNMPFRHPSGLSGKAAADLLLAGSWREAELSGATDLHEAKFEMEQWDKFAPSKEKSRFYEAMSLDIRIAAERNVWYREGANSVEVSGNILVKKDHYRQPAALGSISALKGYYIYLGNTFNINTGLITFTGETPPNPTIDVSATNEERGRAIKVYFNAAGKVRNPQVTLSSDPPMEQRDIIAFLVTGRPLYEMYSNNNGTQQGRAGDNTARNLAAGYISQKAAATVGKKLELDMINLKVDNESRADLTVGRYITRDLFISYGQVLGQGGERRVSAEYSITRQWSLEGKNSSDGRYVADLLFKYGIK